MRALGMVVALLALAMGATVVPATAGAAVVVRNVMVVDGTGAPAFPGGVRIENGTITASRPGP